MLHKLSVFSGSMLTSFSLSSSTGLQDIRIMLSFVVMAGQIMENNPVFVIQLFRSLVYLPDPGQTSEVRDGQNMRGVPDFGPNDITAGRVRLQLPPAVTVKMCTLFVPVR